MNPIEAESTAAVATRNGSPARNGNGNGGNRRRPAGRSRIEAAAAANAAAAAAAQAAGDAMGELYANRLVACLDAEGIDGDLDDDGLAAVLVIVRQMEGRSTLPQRRPDGTGAQPAARL
jgi:hypothetical protein